MFENLSHVVEVPSPMKLLHFLSEVLRMLTMASFSAHCLGWSTGFSGT